MVPEKEWLVEEKMISLQNACYSLLISTQNLSFDLQNLNLFLKQYSVTYQY